MRKKIEKLLKNKLPAQLIIQFTDICNGQCPQCGMRVSNKMKRMSLTDEEVKTILDQAAKKGIKIISFTGGEPLLFLDAVIAWSNYAHNRGMRFSRTGTNGFHFCHPEDEYFSERVTAIAEKLGRSSLRNFWISLDSYKADVHEQMRGLPGVMLGIEKALPLFHKNGIYPSVNLGINRNVGGLQTSLVKEENFSDRKSYLSVFENVYKTAFHRYFEHIIGLGFTMCSVCYPMSIGADSENTGLEAVYEATSEEHLVNYKSYELKILFKLLLEIIPLFRSRIRIFTPLVSLHALQRKYSGEKDALYPCLGGERYFFTDAKKGNIYPCGYRNSDDMGPVTGNQWMRRNADQKRCTACDWECFRDPSEMCGPFWHGLTHPLGFIKKIWNDRDYLIYALKDWHYYLKCGFFNGRKALRSDLIK